MTPKTGGTSLATVIYMSGHNRHKKDGARTDKQSNRRQRDFEQPVVGSVTKQRAQDTSNLTDGQISGPDWKRKDRTERG
jgi:hypothetical protein